MSINLNDISQSRERKLTLEARNVSKVKLGKCDFSNFRRYATDKHWRDKLEIFLRTLVDDASGGTPVDPHCEIFLDRQKLRHMKLAIGHHLVAVHRRGRIITHVVRNPDPPIKELDGDVPVTLSVIEKNPVFLCSREYDGHICLGPRA